MTEHDIEGAAGTVTEPDPAATATARK